MLKIKIENKFMYTKCNDLLMILVLWIRTVTKGKLTQKHQRLASNSITGNNKQHALCHPITNASVNTSCASPFKQIQVWRTAQTAILYSRYHQLAFKWLMWIQKWPQKASWKIQGPLFCRNTVHAILKLLVIDCDVLTMLGYKLSQWINCKVG